MGLTAVEKDWLRVLCGTRPSNAAIVPADRTLFRARGVRTEDDTHLSQVDWPGLGGHVQWQACSRIYGEKVYGSGGKSNCQRDSLRRGLLVAIGAGHGSLCKQLVPFFIEIWGRDQCLQMLLDFRYTGIVPLRTNPAACSLCSRRL